MTRKVAVVGSISLAVTVPIGAQIVDILAGYPDDVVFLTRGSPGVDTFVGIAAVVLGHRCFAYKGSGHDNWERDEELVHDMDELVAIIDPQQLDSVKTGTAHLMGRALAVGKPVRAATVVNDNLVWAGDLRVGPVQ